MEMQMDLISILRGKTVILKCGNAMCRPTNTAGTSQIYMQKKTTDRPVFEWNVMKYKHGFVILNNNADMSYYFGEAHANKIFTVTFTVS